MTAASPPFEDTFFTARDGLSLHVRRYPARLGAPTERQPRPVVCLPGLTRNGRDFDLLARHLSFAAGTPRDVYAFDYRGRGLSGFDSDWRNYAVPIEMLDVFDFLTLAGLHAPAIVGTSRGGLIATVMAAAHPTAIGALVLNDIGPVIEADGLMRIAGYAGRIPLPGSWPEAERLARSLFERDFTAVPEGDWDAIARQLWNVNNGRPAAGYDPKVARSLSVLDGPVPKLWPQFEALKHVPLLVVRGANSDLLSETTVVEMLRRHARAEAHRVPNEGHAPLLRDAPTLERIAAFLAQSDERDATGLPRH